MKTSLLSSAACMLALTSCGERLEFRSDNGLPEPQVSETTGGESDANARPAAATVATTVDEPQIEIPEVTPATIAPSPRPTAAPIPQPVPAPTAVPTPDVCEGFTGEARVLVLDFKSGWFAGDGGQFFRHVVDAKCGGKVQVVYAHLTKIKVEGNLLEVADRNQILPCLAGRHDFQFITDDCRMGSLTSFDAFWVLSGSPEDTEDLIVDEPFFASVVTRLVEAKIAKPNSGFFFGTGLGNVENANTAGAALFPTLGGLFTNNPDGARGVLPSPDNYLKFESKNLIPGTGAGTFAANTPYLKGLTGLFDYAKKPHRDPLGGFALGECFSDPIQSNAVSVVAYDHCNRAVMGQAKSGNHNIVLEGNTARFYGTGGVDYFDRITRFLLIP